MALAPKAFLVLKNVLDKDWSFEVGTHRMFVGRSKDAEIRLPVQFQCASRQHAEIWKDQQCVWIHDLGSIAGTNVNGIWVDHVPMVLLSVKDKIWFGGATAELVDHVRELAHPSRNMDDSDPEATERSNKSTQAGRESSKLLTAAEINVMLWLSRGFVTDDEIGEAVFRSPWTVKTEFQHIFHKLGIHSRAELLGWISRVSPI